MGRNLESRAKFGWGRDRSWALLRSIFSKLTHTRNCRLGRFGQEVVENRGCCSCCCWGCRWRWRSCWLLSLQRCFLWKSESCSVELWSNGKLSTTRWEQGKNLSEILQVPYSKLLVISRLFIKITDKLTECFLLFFRGGLPARPKTNLHSWSVTARCSDFSECDFSFITTYSLPVNLVTTISIVAAKMSKNVPLFSLWSAVHCYIWCNSKMQLFNFWFLNCDNSK